MNRRVFAVDVALTAVLTLAIRAVYLGITGQVMAWWLAAVIAVAIVFLGTVIWISTDGDRGPGIRSGSGGSFLDDLF